MPECKQIHQYKQILLGFWVETSDIWVQVEIWIKSIWVKSNQRLYTIYIPYPVTPFQIPSNSIITIMSSDNLLETVVMLVQHNFGSSGDIQLSSQLAEQSTV